MQIVSVPAEAMVDPALNLTSIVEHLKSRAVSVADVAR